LTYGRILRYEKIVISFTKALLSKIIIFDDKKLFIVLLADRFLQQLLAEVFRACA
jgi:hypothetical protein